MERTQTGGLEGREGSIACQALSLPLWPFGFTEAKQIKRGFAHLVTTYQITTILQNDTGQPWTIY